MKKRLIVAAAALSAGVIAVTGCSSDADVVSENLSKESDQFKINRRVVFFNGITDKYLLSIEGLCSIKDENNQLEVTCKTGDDEYKKHFLGLSDNVSYFVEQLESAEVSRYHYKVIFKPETIIPDIDRP
ncbi:hypothetical protein [Nocardia sp. A7]|uniref:beta-sandwich lipoprotein n=1 Tax=Nocardia sp. A7 TaxID=2789274 RepID=UPI003977F0B1